MRRKLQTDSSRENHLKGLETDSIGIALCVTLDSLARILKKKKKTKKKKVRNKKKLVREFKELFSKEFRSTLDRNPGGGTKGEWCFNFIIERVRGKVGQPSFFAHSDLARAKGGHAACLGVARRGCGDERL